MLIEIEGIDGSGKTTQCDLLKDFLWQHQKVDAVVVREPAGTEFGSELKNLIMSDTPRSEKAEVFSFLAAKAQLYNQIVLPALAEGRHVIADRGSMSFLTYHHISTDISIENLQYLMDIATGMVRPEITFLLDVPPEMALERIKKRGNLSPFDKKGLDFFDRQRELFKHLCASPHCAFINGSLDIEEVQILVIKRLLTTGGNET